MPPVRVPSAEAGPSSVRSERGPPEPSTACPAEAPAHGATDGHTAQRWGAPTRRLQHLHSGLGGEAVCGLSGEARGDGGARVPCGGGRAQSQ